MGRLDWGGIQTDAAGRDALVKAQTVLDFLRDDYGPPPEASADTRKYTDDWLAIVRVQEMVAAMQAREAETLAAGGVVCQHCRDTKVIPNDGANTDEFGHVTYIDCHRCAVVGSAS